MTQQDDITQRVLTDDELDAIRAPMQNYAACNINIFTYIARAVESALLSKLRAPVADERALDLLDTLFTAYESGTPCYEEPDSQGGYLGMAFRIDDDTFRACADLLNKHRPRAALASAPVPVLKDWRIDTSAGGPILVYKDCSVIESAQAEYVLRLIAADQASAPVAVPSNETLRLAGVIADKIEDGTLFQAGIFSRRELADKVRAVVRFVREASTPVAGEAVYTLRVRGAIQAWTPTVAAFSIPDGEHQLFLSPAAPQASAEDALTAPADVAQLVAFIFDRFGQPGDAGALPDNVAAAVRRLERGIKAQADKDGGQQRAGDEKEPQ